MAPTSSVCSSVERGLGDELAGARLDRVLQSFAEAVVVEDVSGRIVWANERAGRFFGVGSAAQLVSSLESPHCDITDRVGHPLKFRDLPGAALLRGEDAKESIIVELRDRRSGRVSWASVSASIVEVTPGRPRLAVSIWRDVTAEQRRQAAARYLSRATTILSDSLDYASTLRRLARVLVPELTDWYCVDVLEGGVLRNLVVEHADPAKVAVARSVHLRMPPHPNDPSGAGAAVRTGRSELYPDINDQMIVAYARGDDESLAMLRELRPLSAMIVPLKARDQTFGAMKLLSGASRRRYDELDLELAEELGRRIGIAIENARLYREAREASRLRDEFLVVAGHELRTPLTALKLGLECVAGALRGGRVADDPRAWTSRLDRTIAHANRLQQLIDHLLDTSYIASQRVVLKREETNLAELWREVIEHHAPEAARAGCTVTLTSHGSTNGQWDRARVDQVLTSLLGNALKFGAGKPVQVTIHGDTGTVTSFVHDDGMGIDFSAQPLIFGRFERAVSVRNYGGFGLGLWLVRELVEAHGGVVGFDSRPGQGSTFRVELPCSARPT